MNVKVKCKMKSTQRSPPVYKYDEDKIISDLKDYIDNNSGYITVKTNLPSFIVSLAFLYVFVLVTL